ncbi:MAG: outer membrane beta-barrel protein [Thiotrichales bacterium]|nr:outer membrane beta-barrel protein [Thiotrichales bacterium]
MKLKNVIRCVAAGVLLFTGPLSALADGHDNWKIRLRGIAIAPQDDSGLISLGTTPLAGSGVAIDTEVVPELDITYMITPNWGIEAIAGIARHTVEVEGPGPVLSGLGLTDGFEIFDTWVLPPTVTLQYHFMPNNNIRPYVGLGVNYTATLDDNATDELEAALGPVSVNTTNSWGWAAQAGVDIDWKDNWFFNLDVKYIDIDTTASLETGLGTLRVDLDVDPVVFGAGIGLRF